MRKGKENETVALRNRKANGTVAVRKGKEKTVAVKLDAFGKHNSIDEL